MDCAKSTTRQELKEPGSRLHLLLFGAILLVYILIAWQSIQAPLFVGDDSAELAYIRSNPSLSQLAQYDGFFFFRPVKNLLFMGFNALLPFGLAACRLLAVAIGLASSIAVYAMFRRLLRCAPAALAAFACWLLAPTLVSCTAWLSCANIQAMIGFAAVAMLLFLDAHESTGTTGQIRLASAWLASLLAMLCYEGAVCLPALFLLIDFFLRPKQLFNRRVWRTYLLFGSTVILYLLLRAVRTTVSHQIQHPNFGEMADWQVMVAAPWFFFQHLSIWLWPFGRQAILGGYVPGQVSPGQLGCAWLGVAALGAGCLLLRRRFVFVTLGIAWCLTAYLPMSNILAFRNGPYGDYYLALASMGLALVFGWSVGACVQHGRMTRVSWLALLFVAIWRVACVCESMAWSQAWNNYEAMLRRTIRTFPHAFSSINEYARLCYRQGADAECLALTGRALALAPQDRNAYELRALVAFRRGDLTTAQTELDRYMKCGGAGESWGWYFQGYLLDAHRGDTNGAIRCYRQAIASRTGWSSDVLDAMTALAFLVVQSGDIREAISLWEQVVQIDPSRMTLRQNLVRAYLEVGEKAKAQEQLEILRQRNESAGRNTGFRIRDLE